MLLAVKENKERALRLWIGRSGIDMNQLAFQWVAYQTQCLFIKTIEDVNYKSKTDNFNMNY